MKEDGTLMTEEEFRKEYGEPELISGNDYIVPTETPPSRSESSETDESGRAQEPPQGQEPPAPEQPPAQPETQPLTADQVAALQMDQNLVLIDMRRGGQDIIRMAKANPEFHRRIMEYAGRQSKRQYETTLSELRAEISALRKELVKRDVEAMPPEELENKIRTDKQFAQEYIELIHDEGADPAEEVRREISFAREVDYYLDTMDELLDNAVAMGMNEARAEQFRRAFTYCPVHRTDDHGFYDHDQNGVFWHERYTDDAIARRAAFDYFRATLDYDVRMLQDAMSAQRIAIINQRYNAGQPAPPPQQAPAAQQQPGVESRMTIGRPNPALQRNPDTSSGVRSAGNKRRYTQEELSQLPPPERIALVQSYGGRERMIEEGYLYVPGLSEKLGYRP